MHYLFAEICDLVISEVRLHSIFSVINHVVGLLSTKWLYWYGLLQTLITADFDQRCRVRSFLPDFSTSSNLFTLQV